MLDGPFSYLSSFKRLKITFLILFLYLSNTNFENNRMANTGIGNI